MNDTRTHDAKTHDNDTFVSIATFPEPSEASLAQSALESAGIESYLQGGSANSLIPVAFTARLLVRSEDEAAAREILQAAETSPESLEDVTAAEAANESKPR